MRKRRPFFVGWIKHFQIQVNLPGHFNEESEGEESVLLPIASGQGFANTVPLEMFWILAMLSFMAIS